VQVKYPLWLACLVGLLTGYAQAEDEKVSNDPFAEGDYTLSEGIRDFDGIRRDSLYFVGYQFAAVGILYVMPESVSGWGEETKDEYSFQKWWDNVRDPRWDTDDFYINYILHPYWGATYYVRARKRGYPRNNAIMYSVLMSTMFEYGIEAMFEQPSIQDLILTPLGGVFFGEYMYKAHMRVRNRIANGKERTWKDTTVLVATDPLGMLNNKIDDLFGRDVEMNLRVFMTNNPVSILSSRFELDDGPAPQYRSVDKIYGVQFKLTF